MLTRIDVRSENSFFVPTIGATPKDNLLLRKVTGLNPPDLNLFIGEYSRDGGIYQGRRVGNRNVVIMFDLNPNPALGETVAGLREMLYKAFIDPTVDADFVKLELRDDTGRELYLVGYTEKFETEIFDIETMAQISLICPDPYIRDNVETVISNVPGPPAEWDKTITYTTGNKVRYRGACYQALAGALNLPPDVNPAYWALITSNGWITVPFAYSGTAETGFDATVYVTSPTSTITLDNNGKTMVINKSFAVGDLIRVCTVRGQRAITVQTGVTETSLIAYLTNASQWFELHSQANKFTVYGATPSASVALVLDLSFSQAYWGI